MKKLICLLTLGSTFTCYAGDGYKSFYDDVNLENQAPVNYTAKFQLKDLNGVTLADSTIAAGIIYSVLSNTQYPYKSSKQDKNTFYKGATAGYSPDKKSIFITYRNEKDYDGSLIHVAGTSDVTYNVKDVIFTLNMNYQPTATEMLAIESVNSSYTIHRSSIFNWGTQDPLDAPIKLYLDLFSVLSPDKIIIPMEYALSGEIDNKFTPDSIYGNLDRLMGKFDWKQVKTCTPMDVIKKNLDAGSGKLINPTMYAMCLDSTEHNPEYAQAEYVSNSMVAALSEMVNARGLKGAQQSEKVGKAPTSEQYAAKLGITPQQMTTTYAYKFGNITVPVLVSVYPYHGQSKVNYKAFIPYTISGTGSTSLTQEQIKQIKLDIEKIINS